MSLRVRVNDSRMEEQGVELDDVMAEIEDRVLLLPLYVCLVSINSRNGLRGIWFERNLVDMA